jgi:hypothetical protein
MMQTSLKNLLNEAIKTVNHINTRPLNTRLFKILCEDMFSEHTTLQHTLRSTVLLCAAAVFVRFEVLMAAGVKMAVFWVVATCSQGDDHPDDEGSKHL